MQKKTRKNVKGGKVSPLASAPHGGASATPLSGGHPRNAPVEWSVSVFEKLTINHDSKRKPVKESDRIRGPYPYYGASGIVDWVNEYLFDGEYLLIAEDGENLRTLQTPIAFLAKGKFWVNNHAHIVTGNEFSDTRFLQYALLNTDISGFLTGAVMPKLTQGNLNKVPILHPNIINQKQIAKILGDIDDKIENNRRVNEILEAMARALFKDWFVDFGPVRAKMEGREPSGLPAKVASLFPSSLDKNGIPSGWKYESIYSISNVTYGAPFSSEKFNTDGVGKPLVRIRDLKDESPGVFTDEVHPKGFWITPGNIIVGMDGEFRAHLWGGEPAWMNQRVCVFLPVNKISVGFVLFSIIPLLAEVESSETATTVIHLGKNDIDRFRVILPSEAILSEFKERVDPLMDQIVENKQQIRILLRIRNALLPKLLSGELDLTNKLLSSISN